MENTCKELSSFSCKPIKRCNVRMRYHTYRCVLAERSGTHMEASTSALNWEGTRSKRAWTSPGMPSWPHAAIWSSPLLGLIKTMQPASARKFLNSIIFSSLVGLKRDPWWGLKDIRLILQGMPLTRSTSLFASSILQRETYSFEMKIAMYKLNVFEHTNGGQ